MSVVETEVTTSEQDDTESTSAPAFDVETATFQDDSRIQDKGRFMSALAKLQEACQSAVDVAVSYTNTTKAVAEARVLIRSTIMRPNGFPDWAADSDVYRQVVSIEEGKIFAKLTNDSKVRLVNAIKQQVKRNYLLRGVVVYILTHEENFGAELDKWNEEDGQDRVMSDPSEKLKDRVRTHYGACGLDVPEGPFKEKKAAKPSTPGPDAGDNPTSALETLGEALGGLSQITPQYATLALLQATSDLSSNMLKGKPGAIEGRQQVIANLKRIAQIAQGTADMIEGNVSGETFDAAMESLVAAYFDSKTDVPA